MPASQGTTAKIRSHMGTSCLAVEIVGSIPLLHSRLSLTSLPCPASESKDMNGFFSHELTMNSGRSPAKTSTFSAQIFQNISKKACGERLERLAPDVQPVVQGHHGARVVSEPGVPMAVARELRLGTSEATAFGPSIGAPGS